VVAVVVVVAVMVMVALVIVMVALVMVVVVIVVKILRLKTTPKLRPPSSFTVLMRRIDMNFQNTYLVLPRKSSASGISTSETLWYVALADK
jgi:hypothetical protein